MRLLTMACMLIAAYNISVVVNGERVIFPDQQPIIVDGNTLVPARGVFEAIGFDVSSEVTNFPEPSTMWITLFNDLHTVYVRVGSDVFHVGSGVYNFPVSARIVNGRAMIPFRTVLESVNHDVAWNAETRTIYITPPAYETVYLPDGEWLRVSRDATGRRTRLERGDENGIILFAEYVNDENGNPVWTFFDATATALPSA